jgi:hypothetical protein
MSYPRVAVAHESPIVMGTCLDTGEIFSEPLHKWGGDSVIHYEGQTHYYLTFCPSKVVYTVTPSHSSPRAFISQST